MLCSLFPAHFLVSDYKREASQLEKRRLLQTTLRIMVHTLKLEL
jgi:hypothetical protein